MKGAVLLAGVAALALSANLAMAQGKAPAKPRSAASIECSKQADAKGLKGKPRKAFRSKCKRELAKAAKDKK